MYILQFYQNILSYEQQFDNPQKGQVFLRYCVFYTIFENTHRRSITEASKTIIEYFSLKRNQDELVNSS